MARWNIMTAETHRLLEKRYRTAVHPLEIAACAMLPALSFAIIHYCLTFGFRAESSREAFLLAPACFFALCLGLSALTYVLYTRNRSIRFWAALTICMWFALGIGVFVGDKKYYQYIDKFNTWQDMAVYVNMDVRTDHGQTFMDSGRMYFKEGTFVARERAVAFHSGATYCVAPIVRSPIESEDGSGDLPTVTGFSVPPSGAYDFWAVGTDCCGENGDTFTCGDVESQLTRSGLRVLDENTRQYYLLAVQEWSASMGLPVKHPLFFHWVKDPIQTVQEQYTKAQRAYWVDISTFFIASIFASFILHAALVKMFRVK